MLIDINIEKQGNQFFRLYNLTTLLRVSASGPPSFPSVDSNIKPNFEETTKLQVDSADCTSPLAVNSFVHLPYILRHLSLDSIAFLSKGTSRN